jgi:hypothetical protein
MQESQVIDSLWVLKHENSDVMIPSPEFKKPLDDVVVAKYSPIRLLAELELVTYEPVETSPAVTPTGRLPLPASIAGALQQGVVAGQAPSLPVAASRSIGDPTHNRHDSCTPPQQSDMCYSQYRIVNSNRGIILHELPPSGGGGGHCNNICTGKAWYRALTATKIPQLNKFIGLYVATPHISGPTSTNIM